MKTKLFFLLFFSSFATMIFAQFNPEPENKKKRGCSITINSIQAQIAIPLMTGTGAQLIDADGNILTGGNRIDKSYSYSIIPKYYINNDVLLRFEGGITCLNLKANSDNKENIHSVSDRELTSKIYRYAPGFQWTFMKAKKIESYCGMTTSYINYKTINTSWNFENRDITTDSILNWGRVQETTPGGFAIGIGALAGFNIYLLKNISLGAELSSSALYYKLGGETISESIDQAIPNPVNSYTGTYSNSYKGFKISKIISSFNISFWF